MHSIFSGTTPNETWVIQPLKNYNFTEQLAVFVWWVTRDRKSHLTEVKTLHSHKERSDKTHQALIRDSIPRPNKGHVRQLVLSVLCHLHISHQATPQTSQNTTIPHLGEQNKTIDLIITERRSHTGHKHKRHAHTMKYKSCTINKGQGTKLSISQGKLSPLSATSRTKTSIRKTNKKFD